MQKVLAVEFDPHAWEKHGTSWLRSVKSKGYVGLVVNNGLPADAAEKLTELKFRVVRRLQKRGGVFDFFATVAANVGDGERCMVVKPDFDFKADLGAFFDGPEVRCGLESDLPLANMVMPIQHLKKRAEAALTIEREVLPAYGGLLSPEMFCADAAGWDAFVGYFDFLSESEFVEVRQVAAEKIALNLYAAYFPGRVALSR